MSGVRIPAGAPRRRSKLHIACSDFLCLRQKAGVRSFRCSSSPNRTRFAGLRFGFGDHDLGGRHIVRGDDFSYRTIFTSHSLCRGSFQTRSTRLRVCFFSVIFACSDFLCLRQKSRSALIPLLLLSKSNPLCWASIWFWGPRPWRTSYRSRRRFFLQNNLHLSLISRGSFQTRSIRLRVCFLEIRPIPKTEKLPRAVQAPGSGFSNPARAGCAEAYGTAAEGFP